MDGLGDGQAASLLEEWSNTHGPCTVGVLRAHLVPRTQGRGTRAIGDAERLHANLGMSVVADYRSADVAAGARAPLVPCLAPGVQVRRLPQPRGHCQRDGAKAGDAGLASDLCGCNLLLNRQASAWACRLTEMAEGQRWCRRCECPGPTSSMGLPESAVASLAAEDLMGLPRHSTWCPS